MSEFMSKTLFFTHSSYIHMDMMSMWMSMCKRTVKYSPIVGQLLRFCY